MIFRNYLRLYSFSTAAAWLGLVLFGILVGRYMRASLLLWRELANGGAAAVSIAFFLALMLRAGVFPLTAGAVFAALLLSWSRRLELITSWTLRLLILRCRLLCYGMCEATGGVFKSCGHLWN